MNQPKKFTDLLAGATPGPWKTESLGHQKHAINAKSWDELATVYGNLDEHELRKEGEINAAFIARCNPAVMREVWEALEPVRAIYAEAPETPSGSDNFERGCPLTKAQVRAMQRAIALLDGQELLTKESHHE